MYCPKCGMQNAENAPICVSCGQTLPRSAAAARVSVEVKTSRLAIVAFVLGIMSIFTLGLAAAPALIIGIIALVMIGTSGGRLTGRAFAVIGIVLSVLSVFIPMAILMPAMARVRDQARMVACMANLRQWNLMFNMYTADNNGKFFSGCSDRGDYWPWQLPYEQQDWRNSRIWFCPTATKPVTNENGVTTATPNIFNAWGVYRTPQSQNYQGKAYTLNPNGVCGSLGLNGYMLAVPEAGVYPSGVAAGDGYRILYNVKHANNVPVMLDGLRFDGWPVSSLPPASNGYDPESNDQQMRRFCINRHKGFVNSSFLDWSVRKVGLKELYTLKWHRAFDTSGPWTLAGGVRNEDWPEWIRPFKDY